MSLNEPGSDAPGPPYLIVFRPSENLHKNSEEVWERKQKNIPQGLKPLVISAFFRHD
jgi:hypothetical protein